METKTKVKSKMLGIHVPKKIFDAIKKKAFKEQVSMTSILRDMIEKEFKVN